MSVLTDGDTSRREKAAFDAAFDTTDEEQTAAEDPGCAVTCHFTDWQ